MATDRPSDRIPSHFLVRVESLHDAVSDFEQAGFHVCLGQRREVAHNALIWFADGPFLELFEPLPHGWQGPAFKVLARVGALAHHPMLSRYNKWIGNRGLCEWAIETNLPLTEVLPAIVADGTKMGKPRPITRQPPEGPVLKWSIATPDELELPFIMDPYRPRPQLPVGATDHANGVTRLVGLDLGHPDPDRHAANLRRYLGSGALAVDQKGVHRLTVGAFEVAVAPAVDYGLLALRAAALDAPLNLQLHGLKLSAG